MFIQAVGAKDVDLILGRVKGPHDRMRLVKQMYRSFSGEKSFPPILQKKVRRVEEMRETRNSFCHDLWGVDSEGNLLLAPSSFASPGSRDVTLPMFEFDKIARFIEELLFADQYKKMDERMVELMHAAAEPVIRHKDDYFASKTRLLDTSPDIWSLEKLAKFQRESTYAYYTIGAVQRCLDHQQDKPEWLWAALKSCDLLEKPWHQYLDKKSG